VIRLAEDFTKPQRDAISATRVWVQLLGSGRSLPGHCNYPRPFGKQVINMHVDTQLKQTHPLMPFALYDKHSTPTLLQGFGEPIHRRKPWRQDQTQRSASLKRKPFGFQFLREAA
jgi:hypothetical protein